MEKLLSPEDVKRIVGGPIKFVIYDDLQKMKSYKELFGKYDKVLLLYRDPLIDPYVGHWVGLKKCNRTKKIIYFDSFGGEPDDMLENIMYNFKNELTRILYDSKYDIHYSNVQLQDINSNVCGRYVALFFKFCYDNIDKFNYDMLNSAARLGITTDELAYLLTK